MLKKIAVILIAVILFSSIPSTSLGASFVKNIDADFGNYQLYLNGDAVRNHKDIFFYNGDYYVSISDLAYALKIEISSDNDTVKLDTKNKLNIDSYNSKIPLVFQRGYELLNKEKIIKQLENEVNAIEGKNTESINYNSNIVTKTIRVGFGNINIYLDGKKINLDKEPLKYNNDIYVALDSIAPYLYITPYYSEDYTYINIDTNWVLLPSTTLSIDNLLGWRSGRNYLLNLQKAELDKRKEMIENLKIPYVKITSLKELEKYLNSYLNKIYDLEVVIRLTKQADKININISFPNSKYSTWTKLTRLDVEDWTWKIYTAIVALYDEDAEINGVIENPYYSQYSNSKYKNYVVFYSKDFYLYFDFTNSKLALDNIVNPKYLTEVLNNNLNKYGYLEFTYDAKLSGDNIELYVYAATDTLSKSSLHSRMGYLETLNYRLMNIYPDVDIYGKIIYPGNVEPLNFYISNNKIRSKDLLEETVDYINKGFGYFNTGIYGYSLKYSLYEMDLNNFKLIVEGNFSVEDEGWISAGDLAYERLNTIVQYATSSIRSLWDANLTVEVVDKNGVNVFADSLE